MNIKTCFVIMPIGDMVYDGKTISASDLKQRYSDLIREAIQKIKPSMVITRADESASPGGITTDVFTQLMFSDYVIADITYPNPNVFYELGIRHASKMGTILLRDKAGPRPPFDLFNLRHIEYENSPTGLKALATELERRMDWFEKNPKLPDNEFLNLARLTRFKFPDFSPPIDVSVIELFQKIFSQPRFVSAISAVVQGNVPSEEEIKDLQELANTDPSILLAVNKYLARHGLPQ